MAFPRDSQRSKVYRAEDAVVKAFPSLLMPAPKTFTHMIRESRLWTDANLRGLTRSHSRGCWGSKNTFGDVTVQLRDDVGFLAWLHGIVHVLEPPAAHHAFHGPNFCHRYLDVVGEFAGAEVSSALAAQFKLLKVKNVPVTPEDYHRQVAKAEERAQRSFAKKEAALADNLMALVRKYR